MTTLQQIHMQIYDDSTQKPLSRLLSVTTAIRECYKFDGNKDSAKGRWKN